MKIAVIGGASSYTPELVQGFLDRHAELPVRELWLMDVATERLGIVGSLARRMVARAAAPFEVVLTTDRQAAIEDASYVITQLRVGGMAARRDDERLGQRHGLIGQETTGVGGFAKALRTIPVVLDVAATMREHAPGALLVNFTNPAGLVTQALTRHAPDVAVVGVCNGPIRMHIDILEELSRERGEPLAHERGSLDTLGLNHLGWYRGFTLDGEDVWPWVLERWLSRLRGDPVPIWEPRFIEAFGVIPNSYLQYFYDTERKIEQQAGTATRAEVVMGIEAELFREYADPALSGSPPGLMKRGGAYYSTVATQLINAHFNDLGEAHIVNVPNGTAVVGWDPAWVLELPARVGRGGITPLPAEPLPPGLAGLLLHVKMYELLTVEAAVAADRDVAWQALVTNPLGPRPAAAQRLLDELLDINRARLPAAWGIHD